MLLKFEQVIFMTWALQYLTEFFCIVMPDKFGPAMAIVKSDVGGNISVSFFGLNYIINF